MAGQMTGRMIGRMIGRMTGDPAPAWIRRPAPAPTPASAACPDRRWPSAVQLSRDRVVVALCSSPFSPDPCLYRRFNGYNPSPAGVAPLRRPPRPSAPRPVYWRKRPAEIPAWSDNLPFPGGLATSLRVLQGRKPEPVGECGGCTDVSLAGQESSRSPPQLTHEPS